jgi:hypothetical protein
MFKKFCSLRFVVVAVKSKTSGRGSEVLSDYEGLPSEPVGGSAGWKGVLFLFVFLFLGFVLFDYTLVGSFLFNQQSRVSFSNLVEKCEVGGVACQLEIIPLQTACFFNDYARQSFKWVCS